MNQIDFFSVVDWPYAYTLNVDDGIERNSQFKPILPYHRLRRPRTSKKLLYKLHGDALYESQYADSAENIVFSQPQYLQAITSEENTDIYEALLSDYGQRHILFIGCSLQNEQDLMYVYRKSSEFQQETFRIVLRRTEPTILEQRNLKNHGINQILLVDSYERFYDDFVAKYKEIQEETRKTIYEHLNPAIYSVENKAESLKLLAGENIFDFANNRFLKGSFHILREAVNQVAKEITDKQCVLLKGRRFSGKTYVLCSLAERFKTKDIFYFPSTSFVDEEIVEGLLLGNKNCLFLFDSNSITPDVYGTLIKLGSDLQQNNNTLIIAVNSSDNYMSTQMNTAVVEINNRFNIGDELNLSCKVLDAFGLTRRTSSQTNLDYLYVLRKDQNVSIPFDDKTDVIFTSAEKRVLLALCALDKLYYSDLIALNFTHKEILAFCSKMEPLVELVPTGPNESTRHSALKLVHNSKLALIELLHAFSEKDICDSVIYIVKRFKPDYHRRRLYIEIILFDTLNQLFSKKTNAKEIIATIYANLQPMLQSDLHYWLQRAKSLYRMANCQEELDDAYTYAKKVYLDGNDSLAAKAALTTALISCALGEIVHKDKQLGYYEECVMLAHESVFSQYFQLHPNYLESELPIGQNTHSERRISNACNEVISKSTSLNLIDMSNEILEEFEVLSRKNKNKNKAK